MTNEEAIKACSTRALAALLVSTKVNQNKLNYYSHNGIKCVKFNEAVTENVIWLKQEVHK